MATPRIATPTAADPLAPVVSPLREWLDRHQRAQAWLNRQSGIGPSLLCRYCLPSDKLNAIAPDTRNGRRIYDATHEATDGTDPLRPEDWFPYQAAMDRVRRARKEQARLTAIAGAQ